LNLIHEQNEKPGEREREKEVDSEKKKKKTC